MAPDQPTASTPSLLDAGATATCPAGQPLATAGAAPFRTPPSPPPLQAWEGFEVRGFLGAGGMGRVFEGWDRRLQRKVALKFLHGHLPGEAALILREGRAQALIDHPHVVKIFEAGEVEGHAYLAMQLVRDGEGATKFVKISVSGAQSAASARKIARTIAESPLVKTAFAGEDANWGRIVMAVGRADEPVNRDRLSIRFGPLQAALEGAIAPTYDEAAMSAYMKNPELEIGVDVGVGRGEAALWTCDLTKRYVEINGDYRS